MNKEKLGNPTEAKGFLRWVEKMGNKLPHPFWLFVWICVFIVITIFSRNHRNPSPDTRFLASIR
jgi:p-aminobenzoyl-glutamate transporter AbgT